jgi:cell division transport system permease protein
MKMKFRIFKNIFKQGFVGMWRNRGMGLASVGSITAVLIILGMVLIIILGINNVVNETKSQFDEIQVFLEDDLSLDQMKDIEEDIKKCKGVESLVFESKEQALDDMKEEWGEEGYLLEGLDEENPLPNTYIIKIEDIEYADAIVKKLDGIQGIYKVKYYKDVIEKLLGIANYIRVVGLVVIAILMFVSIFIISNTIKLTVAARKREINIMKYVGATNGYIRGPFIIEGIFLGIIGAALSVIIVNYGYGYLFKAINEKLYVLFTVYLVPPQALLNDITIMFVAIGVGIGALGSLISLRKYLNV